jgi:hypothetical protein
MTDAPPAMTLRLSGGLTAVAAPGILRSTPTVHTRCGLIPRD